MGLSLTNSPDGLSGTESISATVAACRRGASLKVRRYQEMRKFLIQSLVGSGLALSAFTLGAQQYNPQQYPPQGNYNRPDRENGRNFLLNRVRTDLDMAQSSAYGQDRWKLRRAKESLNDFQARLNSGDFDRRGL